MQPPLRCEIRKLHGHCITQASPLFAQSTAWAITPDGLVPAHKVCFDALASRPRDDVHVETAAGPFEGWRSEAKEALALAEFDARLKERHLRRVGPYGYQVIQPEVTATQPNPPKRWQILAPVTPIDTLRA
jgi:hypothetical protein